MSKLRPQEACISVFGRVAGGVSDSGREKGLGSDPGGMRWMRAAHTLFCPLLLDPLQRAVRMARLRPTS